MGRLLPPSQAERGTSNGEQEPGVPLGRRARTRQAGHGHGEQSGQGRGGGNAVATRKDECVIMVEAELRDETMAEAMFGRASNAYATSSLF